MLTAAEILAANGPVAKLIDGFQARADQQSMAMAVEQALNAGETLVCEAGTGTGKTFAYLIPALLSGQRVVISTGTKHLQDQLFHRDLPLVRKALGLPIETALLKGRANYLCHYRLNQARQKGSGAQSRLLAVAQWAATTGSGDLAECNVLAESDALMPQITSTTENCLGQDCPDYEKCFVLKARRQAVNAELVVVNHHLLLSDMTLRETGFGELLPVVDAIIFDEAHQLPELAAVFFSESISARQLLSLAIDCKSAQQEEAADTPDLLEPVKALELATQHLRLAFGARDQRVPWLQQDGNDAEPSRDDRFEKPLDELAQALADLDESLAVLAERGRLLTLARRRTALQIQHLESFRNNTSSGWVRWLETQGPHFQLNRTPVEVADAFQSRLKAYGCTSVYTSATLAVGDNFSHFAGQMGLSDATQQTWRGPFDYSQQALMYLPQGLPMPQAGNHVSTLIDRVRPVLAANPGGAFMLFTSHRALREAARLLQDEFGDALLVQGEQPRGELLRRFREHGKALLLGTNSFWEGVDVRGEALTCVIIDKLPFPPPDEPVYAARAERMKANGIEPFVHYALPQAILNLKQGIGRLIRDVNDYGVLVLGDPRLQSKGYGKRILNALPPLPRTSRIADVETFYAARLSETL